MSKLEHAQKRLRHTETADLETASWIKHEALYVVDEDNPIADGYVSFMMADQRVIALDPKRIAYSRLSSGAGSPDTAAQNRRRISTDLPNWQNLGEMRGLKPTVLYTTPRLSERSFPLFDNITVGEALPGRPDSFIIGSLKLFVTPVTPEQFLEQAQFIHGNSNWDSTYMITMSRVTDQPMDTLARNPNIAASSFLREFKLGLKQLGLAGITTVVGQPSDNRRAHIYEHMGMELVHDPMGYAFTVLELTDLPPRLRT